MLKTLWLKVLLALFVWATLIALYFGVGRLIG